MKIRPASFCSAVSVIWLALLGGATGFAQTLPGTPATGPAGGPAAAPPAALPGVPDDYRINVEDTINIDVARHGDVTRAFRIPVDGRVRLLRLDSALLVQGKTCAEIADELMRRLQTEGKLRLRPGQVSVYVVSMRPRRVYIRGNAIPNREIDLKNNWRVTELVAEIGGVPQPDLLVTTRLQNADKNLRPEPVTLDLAEILNHPDSPKNISLLEGDTLYLQGPQIKRLVIEGEGPRGTKDLDERLTLRQALIRIGYSPIGATGDIRNAKLWHVSIPGDPNSARTMEPVNLYTLLSDKSTPDVAFRDLDTLEIPVSQRFVYIQGAFGGPQKWYMPEDRKTYLSDVMALGSTTGIAKIGDVRVRHYAADGITMMGEKSYDFGKYKSKGDQKENPEILPGDMVYVPNVKRTDPNAVSSGIFTSWGIFNIFKALMPGKH